MKVWVYRSRSGNNRVFMGDSKGFAKARKEQDSDNRMTLEDIVADGSLDWDGSEEEGHFYIDDGGDIELFEVE